MSDACSGLLANSGPAPPPPPPPPGVGQVPALRISTATERLDPRRAAPSTPGGEPYEPPAAIQNAMMTKDKKPFTYTPGMGGKLDLSQIRSPRMARRVAKNANDEGIEGPPKALADQDAPRSPGTAPQPSVYSQPQVAVPVFPQGVNLGNSCLPRNPVGERQEQPRPVVRVETRPTPATPGSAEQSPTPPMSPTQVTLAKAPTPWMQKQAKQQEELPEWAKRPGNGRSQEPESPQPRAQQQQQQPRQVNPALQQQPRPQMRAVQTAPQQNVPLRIEDRPSVFTAINEPGHHQFVNSNPHHVSRWGNPMGQSGYQPPSAQGAAYIVPVQVADANSPQQYQNNHYNQNQMQYRNAPDNRNVQRSYAPMANQQPEPGPVQSQSFRVLQKITDTYPDQVDGEQLRKLQLTEDDRYLMNKFKEQVDGDTYLHQEEDPRYRGAAIPSRAFRYLQTMTDSADVPNSTSRPVNSVPKKPNRHSNTFEEVPMQPYIPASQQQVQEPKKYTGGAIPSRSFRILQQMTTPESIAIEVPQESRRDDDSTTTEQFNEQAGACSAAIKACSLLYWDPQAYHPLSSRETHHRASLACCPHHCLCHSHHCHCCGLGAAQIPYTFHNNIIASAFASTSDRDGDRCTFDTPPLAARSHGNLHARNSALYLGSPWRCDSSATTDRSDSRVNEGQPTSPFASSPLLDSSSLLHSDNRCDEIAEKPEISCSLPERCNDNDNEFNNNEEEEEDVETENSSDSSCGSESFWAYSTGLNPLNRQREEAVTTQENTQQAAEDSDSTHYEVSQFEDDDSCTGKNEENHTSRDDDDDAEDGEKNDNELEADNEQEDDNTIVSVSLPLRFKFSVSDEDEDVTTVIVGDSTVIANNVETCVDFTLKRAAGREISVEKAPPQEAPTFVLTTSDSDTEAAQQAEETTHLKNTKDEGKDLLCVRNNSKEEITDDEDSGVTSDVSRIISEADTDSECCQSVVTEHDNPAPPPAPVARRFGKNKVYERTQTHSRLFKLLSDEQLLSTSTNSESTEATVSNDQHAKIRSTDSLTPRPKSLDCQALYKHNQVENPHCQSWNRPAYSALPEPQIYPRLNVYCPRTNGFRNIPRVGALENNQQLRSHARSSHGNACTTTPSNIPTPIRLNRRC